MHGQCSNHLYLTFLINLFPFPFETCQLNPTRQAQVTAANPIVTSRRTRTTDWWATSTSIRQAGRAPPVLAMRGPMWQRDVPQEASSKLHGRNRLENKSPFPTAKAGRGRREQNETRKPFFFPFFPGYTEERERWGERGAERRGSWVCVCV